MRLSALKHVRPLARQNGRSLTHNTLLCDIGNTNFSFSDGKKISVDDFDVSAFEEKVYFICVNPYWEKQLEKNENWINLRSYIDFSKYYESMGIDRIVCCEAVENAVIVDAGSAITVDLIEEISHKGGYIYPGFTALAKCFKDISPRLEVSFNFDLDLATMPKNTEDALSYGAIAPLVSHISSISDTLPVILTGGDAEKLFPLIPNAVIDHKLVFKGMNKIIQGRA